MVVLTIYYAAHESLDADVALVIEGFMLLFASVMISYFFVTHLAPGMKSDDQWKTKWERKMGDMVEKHLSGTNNNNFFWLTLTNVFREGVEAVVFITGIGAMYAPVALVIPSLAGMLVGCVMGVMMFMGSRKLDLSGFFVFSALLLLFIAAGLAAHASYEFQKAGVFGNWACYTSCNDGDDGNCQDDAGSWDSYRRLASTVKREDSCDGYDETIPWVNIPVYDITGCCDTSNMFFFLMMVLFWYRPTPTNLEVVIYCLYWPMIVAWGRSKIKVIQEYNETLKCPDASTAKLVVKDVEMAPVSPSSSSTELVASTQEEQKF